MTLERFVVRHAHNEQAGPDHAYGDGERAVLSRDRFGAAQAEIASWPGYAPTPLVDLPGLAAAVGVGSVHYKDEGKRFGLKSFKALGGAYAVLGVLQRHLAEAHGLTGVTAADLAAGEHRDQAAEITVACATDGNHGRSVAWGAGMFGCGCNIYLHAHVSADREREIAKYGARIVRVAGNYDESVDQCAADCVANGWVLVADTDAGGGVATIPAMVMQGYTVMVQEFIDQMAGRDITHVFVPGGVGGIAAAVGAHLWETLGPRRPRIAIVEPSRADCIYRSIVAGEPTPVPGDFETFMACLAAGQISPVAWPFLKATADDVLTLPDEAAAAAMRVLAQGVDGDPPLVAGESGSATTAGLIAVSFDDDVAGALGLGADSHVILIGSEGATDAAAYEQVVGESAEAVESRAA